MANGVRPPLPEAESIDGASFVGRQGGVLKRFLGSMLRGVPGKDGAAGLPGKDGAAGLPGRDGTAGADGAAGAPGTPKRVEIYASTTAGKVVFSTAFATIPVVIPNPINVGGQLVIAMPLNVTKTGCDVTVMRSRATLVLSTGPFEVVTSVAGSVLAIGS